MRTAYLVTNYSENEGAQVADSLNSLRDLLDYHFGAEVKTPNLDSGFAVIVDSEGKDLGSVEAVSVWTRRSNKKFAIRL